MKKYVLAVLSLLFAVYVMPQETRNVVTHKFGAFKISVLSEGQGQHNKDILIDATEEMIHNTIPDGTFLMASNVFLLQTPDKNILIDAGYGKNLDKKLMSININPNEIDIILLTHMHDDHIGGLLSDDNPVFPNAELYISQKEYTHWIKQNGTSQLKIFNVYDKKTHLFDAEELESNTQLINGVKAIKAFGHTPGHCAYFIESEGASILIWGDLTHAVDIQIPYPKVAVIHDNNVSQAITSREKILEFVAENNILIGGMHIPYPAMGKIMKTEDEGYLFTPIDRLTEE